MKAIAVVSVGAFLIGCQPQSAPAPETDVTDVRALFDSVVAQVRAANWTAWANGFTDDARFHAANAPAMVGRPAILAWAQALPPIETFSFENVQAIREGNTAWGTSAVIIKLKDLPTDTTKQLVIMKRDSTSGWRVVAVSLSSDLPLPAPPPPTRRR